MSRKRGSNNNKLNCVLERNNVETYTLVHECRVCLQAVNSKHVRDMLSLSKEKGSYKGPTIAHDFEKITNIKVLPTDDHSKFICNQCTMKLNICLQFIQMAQHSDNILHKRCAVEEPIVNSPTKLLWPKPIQIDKVIGADNLEVEVKQEVLSDDENVMETEELDHEELRMDIKVEPEEYQYKDIPVHGIFSQDNITQVNGDQHIDNNLDFVIKEEPLSDQEDVEMAPDLSLDCMLCMKTFNSVSGLKAHVIAQHSYETIDRKTECKKEMFRCTTCGRNFLTNTDLIVHETCHYTHACYMCNNKFDTFAQLTKHRKKCPKNIETVTRVKTLEDVKRPSPEPQQLVEHKESKQPQNVPETDQIDSTNTQHESHKEISNSTESNSMEIDNEQQNSIEHTKINDIAVLQTSSNIKDTEVNEKDVSNEQEPELKSLVSHSVDPEQNNPNIEPNSPETESTVQMNSNEHFLDANNSIENLNLDLSSSQSDLNNTNSESYDIQMSSKTSNLEVTSNSELISVDKNNVFNLEPVPSKDLQSAETDQPLEISGEIEKDTVTTTVVIGNTKSKLHVKSNNSKTHSLEPNQESSLNEETYNSHLKPDSPRPENNSSDTANNSPDTENISPDTEINSLQTKPDSPSPEIDSSKIKPVSPNHEVSSDLESKNSHTELNPESNTSIEPSSLVSQSANENKPEEKQSSDDGSTAKEEDSDMKIHLEIHSIDKKMSIDKDSEVKALDTVELNEDSMIRK